MNLLDLARSALANRSDTSAMPATAADGGTHYCWRVAMAGREPFEVRVLPESTAAEMRAQYPGANVAPLPELPRRTATLVEAAELRELIAAILPDEAERPNVLRVACADPEAALTSFRLLAAEARERAIWGSK